MIGIHIIYINGPIIADIELLLDISRYLQDPVYFLYLSSGAFMFSVPGAKLTSAAQSVTQGDVLDVDNVSSKCQ